MDSTGLLNKVQQNFLDLLVAVFVDDPTSWTTACWAWATGMLVIFVILVCCICSSFFTGSWNKQLKYRMDIMLDIDKPVHKSTRLHSCMACVTHTMSMTAIQK